MRSSSIFTSQGIYTCSPPLFSFTDLPDSQITLHYHFQTTHRRTASKSHPSSINPITRSATNSRQALAYNNLELHHCIDFEQSVTSYRSYTLTSQNHALAYRNQASPSTTSFVPYSRSPHSNHTSRYHLGLTIMFSGKSSAPQAEHRVLRSASKPMDDDMSDTMSLLAVSTDKKGWEEAGGGRGAKRKLDLSTAATNLPEIKIQRTSFNSPLRLGSHVVGPPNQLDSTGNVTADHQPPTIARNYAVLSGTSNRGLSYTKPPVEPRNFAI